MNRSLAAGLGVLALLSAPDAAAADDGRLVWSHFTGDASGTARIVSARRTVDLGCADPCDSDQIPGWTPDGRHITFTRIVRPVRPGERLGALGRAPRRGPRRKPCPPPLAARHRRRLRGLLRTLPPRRAHGHVRARPHADITSAIFAMDVRTRRARQLTPWALDAEHPDPSRRGVVALETFGHGIPDGRSQDVATVPVGCGSVAACTSQIRYVTHNGAGPTVSADPAWSPNGRRLGFAEWSDGTPADIWSARPDGSDRRQVSTSPFWDSCRAGG